MYQQPIGFDCICRTCMLDSSTLLPLFDINAADTEAAQMLASFTTIMVNTIKLVLRAYSYCWCLFITPGDTLWWTAPENLPQLPGRDQPRRFVQTEMRTLRENPADNFANGTAQRCTRKSFSNTKQHDERRRGQGLFWVYLSRRDQNVSSRRISQRRWSGAHWTRGNLHKDRRCRQWYIDCLLFRRWSSRNALTGCRRLRHWTSYETSKSATL